MEFDGTSISCNAEGCRRFAPIPLGSPINSKMTTFSGFVFARKQPNHHESWLPFVGVIHFLEEPRGLQFDSRKNKILPNTSDIRLNRDDIDQVLSTTLIDPDIWLKTPVQVS
jgi:hypothetical protein